MSYVKGIPPTFKMINHIVLIIFQVSTEQPYSDENFYKDPTTGKK